MINHARTLLLNVSGPSPDLQASGEEYVPTEFRLVQLPTELQTLRTILFGTNPDRLYLNFRLRQYMQLIHSTKFGAYIEHLDPRVTYLPFPTDTEYWFGTSVQPGLGNSNAELVLQKQQPADESRGLTTFRWQLVVNTFDGSVGTATVTYQNKNTVVPFTYANGVGSELSLSANGLSVCFNGLPSVGDDWRIECRARPTRDVGEIIATVTAFAGQSDISSLFSSGEPFATFAGLWLHNPITLYRFVGLLLALIYRTNIIRGGN